MDVLLIDPPYISLKGMTTDCGYNIGLTSLAAYNRQRGVETGIVTGDLLAPPEKKWTNIDYKAYANSQSDYLRIVDDNKHIVWERLSEIIKQAAPKLVGVTYYSPMDYVVKKVARLIKEIDPEMKVAAGAFHPTFLPLEVIQNKDIDFVIRGEGEIPLSTLALELKKKRPDFSAVPGLYYRDREGKVLHNPDAGLIENLDELPFPARDAVLNCDYTIYRDHCMSSARGCPYLCSFCGDKGLWGGRVRRRSVGRIIKELKELKQTYDVNLVDFVDGTFTYDRSYMEEFCHALLDENLDIKWRCTARYDNIDEDLLKLCKKANCVGFYFGMESGSSRILDAVHKKTTVQEIIKVNKMVNDYGFGTVTSIIMGLPYETREDMKQTIEMMRTIKTNIFDVSSYVPLPGSPLYQEMDEKERANIDWKKTAFKSLDNYFLKTMSHEEFNNYLLEAYDIANQTWEKSLAAMQEQGSNE